MLVGAARRTPVTELRRRRSASALHPGLRGAVQVTDTPDVDGGRAVGDQELAVGGTSSSSTSWHPGGEPTGELSGRRRPDVDEHVEGSEILGAAPDEAPGWGHVARVRPRDLEDFIASGLTVSEQRRLHRRKSPAE
jgi:hypothetical protein